MKEFLHTSILGRKIELPNCAFTFSLIVEIQYNPKLEVLGESKTVDFGWFIVRGLKLIRKIFLYTSNRPTVVQFIQLQYEQYLYSTSS